MSALLSLRDVSHTYHSKRGETPALSHIDLEVRQGQFYGVVGPSGSGKTTLLSIMAGVLPPTQGQVLLDGKPLCGDKVGYMLQRDQLFEWRTIWRNVLLGLEIGHNATPENVQYAAQLLRKYGLYDFRMRYPHELSGGMRQRAALIRTLAMRPRLVLLDEPFSALDFQTRLSVAEDVHAIIKNEGLTAVLVTHDISEAIALCDCVAVFTARPARVQCCLDIDIESDNTLARREDPRFAELFKRIWKEMEIHEEESMLDISSSLPNSSKA